MAHARGGRFPRRSGSLKSRKEWGDGPISTAVQSATAAGTTLISGAQQSLQAQTVLRIRGELTLWVEAATSIGDGFTAFTAGIGMVNDEAFLTGATAVPTPSGDPDWPGWIWYYAGSALISRSVTEVEEGGPLGAVRIPIDSKAMRKWGLNQDVFGAVSLVAEVGTATISFVMRTRLLAGLT